MTSLTPSHMNKCKKCLANWMGVHEHICDPLMLALVKNKKTNKGSERRRFFQTGFKEGQESILKNVGMLRQWINERPSDSKLLTNEDITYWLKL